MSEMLQLRVSLVGSEPEIWRRVVVDPRLTMEQLHTVIQVCFGWENAHLHRFVARDGTQYGRRMGFEPEFEKDIVDERKVLVSEVFNRDLVKVAYEYDFGDSWLHEIQFEKRVDSETVEYPFETFVEAGKSVFSGKKRAAICIGGERDGPPEDSGGIHCYSHRLSLMGRPRASLTKDERDEVEWLEEMEVERFQLGWINQNLGRVRVKKAFLERTPAGAESGGAASKRR
jgi:hypothetical protein